MRTIKQIFSLTIIMLASFTFVAAQSNTDRAREEINEGARLYKAGDYVEAQKHFERALELDSANKNAPLFTARTIQQQYRPGVDTPENIAKGMEAVEAYKRVLANDPDNDDAYKAVVFLYGQMRNQEMVREMLTQRAERESVSPEKRAEAYVILASRQWDCYYEITEQKENKGINLKSEPPAVKYRKPRSKADFDTARRCAVEGLKLVEQAISLEPDNPNAWAYKANLLREMAKLSEMEGDVAQEAQYLRQFDEAMKKQIELREAVERKKEEEHAGESPGNSTQPESDLPISMETLTLTAPVHMPQADDESASRPTPPKTIVSGGVLNGKAIRKPSPEYPPIAIAARAQGTVVVQIVVDEEGKVISAHAVSGHPLLQQASVEAARRARFSPVRLNGQPIKVSGVVTYNFVLR
ncbi:MAG: TonB family protein [Acidobacteria bacterium]|nr:TonB family protein [Acidobacteriota bacterium]